MCDTPQPKKVKQRFGIHGSTCINVRLAPQDLACLRSFGICGQVDQSWSLLVLPALIAS